MLRRYRNEHFAREELSLIDAVTRQSGFIKSNQLTQMSHKPLRLTRSELQEISASKALQEICAAEDADQMREILEGAYTAKFHFTNESPGYAGDLFLIQPSYLCSELPVIRLKRNRFGKIALYDEPESFIAETAN
jgi:hypothetical protein